MELGLWKYVIRKDYTPTSQLRDVVSSNIHHNSLLKPFSTGPVY